VSGSTALRKAFACFLDSLYVMTKMFPAGVEIGCALTMLIPFNSASFLFASRSTSSKVLKGPTCNTCPILGVRFFFPINSYLCFNFRFAFFSVSFSLSVSMIVSSPGHGNGIGGSSFLLAWLISKRPPEAKTESRPEDQIESRRDVPCDDFLRLAFNLEGGQFRPDLELELAFDLEGLLFDIFLIHLARSFVILKFQFRVSVRICKPRFSAVVLLQKQGMGFALQPLPVVFRFD
jgi:hypothetical protein